VVDIAKGRMVGAGQVIELVAKIPIPPGRDQVQEDLEQRQAQEKEVKGVPAPADPGLRIFMHSGGSLQQMAGALALQKTSISMARIT
jgi:hypothetical protein